MLALRIRKRSVLRLRVTLLLVLLLVSVLFTTVTDAASSAQPPVALRLQTRDVARYLGLTPEQQSAMNRIHADWSAFIVEQQRVIGGKTPSKTQCQQSTKRQAESMQAARAVLLPAQLEKLAALEAAFLLMPVIESAQVANLMSNTLTLPPLGMPGGSVELGYAYARVPAVALPGCETSVQRQRIFDTQKLGDGIVRDSDRGIERDNDVQKNDPTPAAQPPVKNRQPSK